MRCNAKARSGSQCSKSAIEGMTKCRFHGGLSLKGAAHPRYKDGTHSKYMPKRLGQLFDEAMLDPDFLSQRKRIAQMTAICDERWERLAESKRVANWSEAKRIWDEMWAARARHTAAVDAGDAAEADRQAAIVSDRTAQFEALLSAGAGGHVAWQEFDQATDRARKLIESERRRAIESQQVISMATVTMIIDRLADIVRRNVTNKSELRAISVEFVRELGQSPGTEAGL